MAETLNIDLEAIAAQSEEQNIDFFDCFTDAIAQYDIPQQLKIYDSVGYQCYQALDFASAITFWRLGGAVAMVGGFDSDSAGFLSDIGNASVELGEYQQAIDALVTAEQRIEDSEDERLIDIVLGLSQAYRLVEDRPSANHYAKLALRQAQSINTYFEVCRAHLNLGNSCSTDLDYHLANEHYLKALEHAVTGELDTLLLATIQMNLGNSCKHFLDNDGALVYFQQAESIFKQRKSDEIYALYINMAIVYSKTHQFDEAQQCLDSALAFYQHINNHADSAICLINLGRLEEERGNNDKALDHHFAALAIFERNEALSASKSTCFLNIANCYLVRGEQTEALNYYQQCKDSGEVFEQINLIASGLKGFGDIYHNQGKYQLAQQNYHQCLTLSEQCGDSELVLAVSINLGSLYSETGELERAVKLYQSALTNAQQLGHDKYEISVLVNIASLYLTFNQIELAHQSLYRALDKVTDFADASLEAKVYSTLANLFEITGQFEHAIDYCLQAIALKQDDNASALGLSYGSLARLYEQLEDVQAAYQYYEKAQALFEQANDLKHYNIGAVNFSFFLYQQNLDKDRVSQLQQDALDYFSQHHMHESLVALYANLGLMVQDHDIDKAKGFYQQALDIHQSIVVPLLDESWHIFYRQQAGQIYQRLIDIQYQQKAFGEVFDSIQGLKSSTFLKKIAKHEIKKPGDISEQQQSIIDSEQALFVELEELKVQGDYSANDLQLITDKTAALQILHDEISIFDPAYPFFRRGERIPFSLLKDYLI